MSKDCNDYRKHLSLWNESIDWQECEDRCVHKRFFFLFWECFDSLAM